MILLIIEDDQLFAELVTLAINAPKVRVAGTMRQGFAMIELQRPNFIVLDLSLPDSSTEQTLKMIPRLKELSGGAVITVVTGYDAPEIERQARMYGADHFVPKDPGDDLVRRLAKSHSQIEPCASRDTVEQIEKHVVKMTGSTGGFGRKEVPHQVLKKVLPLLSEDEKKG